MTLTQEQFKKARDAGFTIEQIAEFEKKRESESDVSRSSGVSATWEEQESLPKRAIKHYHTEYYGPVAHGVSTALGRVPLVAAKKAGVKEQFFPEQTTLAGKGTRLLAEGIGLKLGIAGKAAIGAAGLIPKAGAGLKGLIGSATIGAIQTPDEGFFAPKARAIQAGIYAASGWLIGSMVGKYESIKATKMAKEASKKLIKIKGTKADLVAEKSLREIQQKEIFERTKKATIDNIKKLNKGFHEELTKVSPNIKPELNNYFKAQGTTYGDSLEYINESVGKISKVDAIKFLKDRIAYMSKNPDLVKTKSYKDLNKLYKALDKKYGDTVDFKDIYSDIKNFLKGRSYSGGSDVENVVYDEIRHSFGDVAASKSAAFKPMQEQASGVLQFKKAVAKFFQPGSEYNTKNIESLLKKYFLGKELSAGETRIMENLQRSINLKVDKISELGRQLQSQQGQIEDLKYNQMLKSLESQKNFIEQVSQIDRLATKNQLLVESGKLPAKSFPKRALEHVTTRLIDVAAVGILFKHINPFKD